MAEDGSVIIVADVDDKAAQRELNSLAKKIDGLKAKIEQSSGKKMAALEQAQQLGVELDNAKAKLAEMQAASSGAYTADQITEQKENVRLLQTQWDAAQKEVEKYDRAIASSNDQLELAQNRAGELAGNLATGGDAGSAAGGQISSAMEAATKRVERLGNRIVGLARRVFVFTLISKALRGLRDYLWQGIQANNEASAAIARLKGALYTLAQPILQVVIPAFTQLVNILATVITAIAQFIAMLFGKSLKQYAASAKGLNSEKKALKGVGGAAKEAAKSLASFDEINQLAGDTAAGGGGAGGGDISPDFDISELEPTMLQKVAELIKAIGAALLAWKLSDSLLSGLRMFLGLMLAIHGAEVLAAAVWDAWANGVSWANLAKSIGGLALLVGGLALAFGKVGAAAGLIVGGLILITTAFKDIYKNGLNAKNVIMLFAGALSAAAGVGMLMGASLGTIIAAAGVLTAGVLVLIEAFKNADQVGWNLGNTLSAVAGIILTGLGISLLTGTLLPALVAGILAVLFAIATLSGNGAELIENLRLVFDGFIKFFTGVFTGDWKRAWEGVKQIFKGVWNGIVIILESAANLIIRGINWLIRQINKISFTAPSWIPGVGGKKIGFNIPSLSNISIPRLAEGAVIPPNREFMAVLGDQTSGTNIETPLSTMIEAFKAAMSENGGGAVTVVVNLDGREIARNTVKHVNSMARMQGASGLLR